MIIYEVNLSVDKEILTSFQVWLDEHIKEILTIDGFISAEKLMDLEDENNISVRYLLENTEKLNQYFSNHAEKFRDKGKKEFGNKFKANRRILKMFR